MPFVFILVDMNCCKKYIWFLALSALLVLGACRDGGKSSLGMFPFLDSLGVVIDGNVLLGDTLTLSDIYCGDQSQKNELCGVELTREQYHALIVPAGDRFMSEMSLWQLLGVRDVGNGKTLAVYYAGNNVGYCVILVTYGPDGRVLDAINTRESHLVWRANLSEPDNDRSLTIDSYFTFAGDSVTLHRLMGGCMMDFHQDLKGKPMWQQAWDQEYTINEKGHFVLQRQHVIRESGNVDYYAAMDLKSWDLLVCSLHDPGIMDIWNDFVPVMESTYAVDYADNPFPWDVTELYRMNPQRFLTWMASNRGQENRLMRYFKLSPSERPELLSEIGRLEDPDARQWLTSIVNSWDDKPLTKHL